MTRVWAASAAAVVLAAFGAASAPRPRLRAAQLWPDGSYAAAAPGRAVRFTFAPEAPEDLRGVELERFELEVRSASGAPILREAFASQDPSAEVLLPPGRHRWSVRWWSADGEASASAEAEVLVPWSGPWGGVPWHGDAVANEFAAEAAVKGRVELLVATLGFGHVLVNGKEVSGDRLTHSGLTDTSRRVLYRQYDITGLLNASGGAEFLVRLGCGYRCDPQNRLPAYKDHGMDANDNVAKVFRLAVVDAEGGLLFHSGSLGWSARLGPTRADSLYDGELYDAAAAGPWRASAPLPFGAGPVGKMVPATFPAVQVLAEDAPVSISQPAPGIHVVDFGANVAGVCALSVPSAATVSLRHGEVMQHGKMTSLATAPNPSRVLFDNLRSARQNDTLVADGPLERWTPRFTYHGFRYVEVYGYPGNLGPDAIRRLRLGTAVPDRANATFPDEVLQAIHMGSRGTQRSNLMLVPTDCPQRDERLGWLADAGLSIDSMLEHFRMGDVAEAWIDAMADAVAADGSLPDVVPFQRFGGRPADLSWSAGFFAALHAVWRKDGDLRPARDHWSVVKSHVGNLRAQYHRAGSVQKLPERYGDWVPPPIPAGSGSKELPPQGFAAAFSLVYALQQASELGEVVGGRASEDAKGFKAFAAQLADEFQAAYYDPSKKRYANGAMITYILPFTLGIVPAEDSDVVFKNLIAKVDASNGTWTGGIINNRFLWDVLGHHGAAALASAMLRRRDYPSFGYMYFNSLEPASESMWELPDAPYQGSAMNSRNHHCYSSVGSYLLTGVAGLSQRGPANFSAVVGDLPRAAVRARTRRGVVDFSWSRGGGEVVVDLAVPVGGVAEVYIPSLGQVELLESGTSSRRPASSAAGVRAVRHGLRRPAGTFARVVVGSGRYRLVGEEEEEVLVSV